VKSRPGEETREPVTLGGQRRSGGRARQVFGDGMHGRSKGVKQGDLSDSRWAFIAAGEGTKNLSGRGHSTHSSGEAG